MAGVRAMTMQNAAPTAPLVNRLRPSMIQPPSARTAVVRSPAGSDPAPGGAPICLVKVEDQ